MRSNQIILLYLLCLLFVSCTNDNDIENQPYSPSLVNVDFSVTLPVPEEVQAGGNTRGTWSDTEIRNVTLLVFDNNKMFLDRIDINYSDLIVVPGGVKFTVRLDASPNNRTIHMIANARTASDAPTDRIDFSGLATTKTEAEIIPTLKTREINGSGPSFMLGTITPLIMWGRADLPNISITTKVEGVKLLRSAACIKIKKKENTPALDAFEILGMTVHKGPHLGYVAPSAYLAEAATPDSPKALAIPTFLNTDYCWSMGSTPSLYVYDRSVAESGEGLSLIFTANFQHQQQAYYYKIMLAKDGKELDVIRNHRYTITIVGVDDRGYNNLKTAINSPASNIQVDIVDDDEDYPFIQADSEDWIGVSHNQFEVYGTKTGDSQTVEICTVYTNRAYGDGGYFMQVESSEPWLRGLQVNLIHGETNKHRVTANSFLDETGSSFRSAIITIRCQNLSHTIIAKWTKQIPGDDGGGYCIYDLLEGDPGMFKSWTASIPDPDTNTHVRLHPTSAISSPAGGCVTSLTSKYAPNAYLHVEKGTDRVDEVHLSYAKDTDVAVRRIIIAQ